MNELLPSRSNKIDDQLHVYNQHPRYDISDLKLNDKTHQDSIPIIDSLKSTSEIILLSETSLENLDLDFSGVPASCFKPKGGTDLALNDNCQRLDKEQRDLTIHKIRFSASQFFSKEKSFSGEGSEVLKE